MPEELTSLVIRVNALEADAAERKLDNLEKTGGKLEKRQGKLKKSSMAMNVALRSTAVAATAVTAALVVGARKWLDYDKAMKEVHSITDLTSDEMRELRKEVLRLSASMGTDAADSARAMYQAISAGVPSKNIIDFLATSSELAIAGVTDTATAVDGLTNIINAFKLETSDADGVAEDLFKTVRLGKTTVEELSSNISKASVTASALGIEYEELLATFISITKQGTKSSEAFTQQNALFTALIKPTKELRLAYDAMGVETAEAAIEARGLDVFLQDLAYTFGDNTEAAVKALSSVDAFKGLLSVTGENAVEVSANLAKMREETDELGRAVDINSETLGTSFNKLWAGTQLFVEGIDSATGVTKDLIAYMDKAAEGAVYLAEVMGAAGSSMEKNWAIGAKAWEDSLDGMTDGLTDAERATKKLNATTTQQAGESKADFEFRIAMAKASKEFADEEVNNSAAIVKGTEAQIESRKKFIELLEGGAPKDKKTPDSASGERSIRGSGRQDPNALQLGVSLGLGSNEDQINARFENDRAIILENTRITEEQRTELEIELTERRNMELAELDRNKNAMILGTAAQTFDGLAGLTLAFAGEQSAAYKVLFGISKGFAIAEATIGMQVAISKAMALGFPANIPAIAQAATFGGNIISSINSLQAGNFADGGIVGGTSYTGDNMQANVNSGEMILNGGQQKELFSMANGSSGGSGGVKVVINNLPGQEVDVKETETDQGKQLEFTIKQTEKYLATQMDKGTGALTQSIARNTNARRK